MARSRADEKRDDLCRGKELTLRNSVAGLSLLPLGYDRKERLQTGTYLTLTQNRVRAFGTYFGRKKNFQTKACVHPRLLGVFIRVGRLSRAMPYR
jgi:hypothetical protein